MFVDFPIARHNAYDHLSRFFTVERINNVAHDASIAELWSVELEIDCQNEVVSLPIIVVLLDDFPLSLPKIYLNKEHLAKLGFLPGINSNGFICTFDQSTNIPNPEGPESIVETCVRQAKRIIESGLRNNDQSRYEQEFIAYWENAYGTETLVETRVLSFVSEFGTPPDQITYVSFKKSAGFYHSAVYSKPDEFQIFKNYLLNQGVSFKEYRAFHLGILNDLCPPFNFKQKDVRTLVSRLGLDAAFDQYLKSGIREPVVTFTKVINGRNLVFGWKQKNLSSQSGRQRKKKHPVKRRSLSELRERLAKVGENTVERFSPQIFTPQRMRQRTSADYDGTMFARHLNVLVAGLGSVGSNLVPLLESVGVRAFRLVDDDHLSLENIARHLLGFRDIGLFKVTAIRNYLQAQNPLCQVEVRTQKIVQLVQQDPLFIADCDYHLFCTGDINAESWIAQNMHSADWGRPSFFIWVEPYLAGGHCVYLTGKDRQVWGDLFNDHKFVWNVIPSHVHVVKQFTKREAGCQVSYTPFDPLAVKVFLTSLFPYITDVITGKRVGSRVFSWIGDLNALQRMNIPVSEFIGKHSSFTIVERLLC